MATTTTNYGLTKPEGSDFYDIGVQNDNMDIIDKQMKANAKDIAQLNSEYTILMNGNIQDSGLKILSLGNKILLQGVCYLPFDFDQTTPVCTIKKNGTNIKSSDDQSGLVTPIYIDGETNHSVIICKKGSSEFYPNSTLKAGYWFVSALFLVD